MSDLLAIKDVAEYLRVGPVVVRMLVNRKDIPFVVVGISVRFRPQDIEDWIDRKALATIARYEFERSRSKNNPALGDNSLVS